MGVRSHVLRRLSRIGPSRRLRRRFVAVGIALTAVGLAALPFDLPILGGPGTISEVTARSPVLLLAAQREPAGSGSTFSAAQLVAIVRARSNHVRGHRDHGFDAHHVVSAIFRSERARALLERAGIKPGVSVVVARGTAPWAPPPTGSGSGGFSGSVAGNFASVAVPVGDASPPLPVDITLGEVTTAPSKAAPPVEPSTTTAPPSQPSTTTTPTTTTPTTTTPATTPTTTTRPAAPGGQQVDVSIMPAPGSPAGQTPIGVHIDDSLCVQASADAAVGNCPQPTEPTTTTTTTTTPTTTAPDGSDASALGASFGLANGFPIADPVAFGRELDATKATGAQWYRGDVLSNAMADSIVPMVQARGLKFFAILGGSGRTLDPGTAAAIVAKYGPSHGGGIDAVEILNEPDLRISAATYLGVVDTVVPAIRAADPRVEIVVGAVSNAAPGSPFAWFNALYAANGGGPLPGDAISYHDYLAWPGALQKIYAIMQAHGDGGKKLWNSETGRSTADVSAGQQAADVARIVREDASLPFLGVTFLYQIRDVRTGDGVQYDNYGLYDSGWRPKPALQAFVSALAAP